VPLCIDLCASLRAALHRSVRFSTCRCCLVVAASLRAAACCVVSAALRAAMMLPLEGAGRSPFSPRGLASLRSLPTSGGSLWFPFVGVGRSPFFRSVLRRYAPCPSGGSLWFPLWLWVAVRPFPLVVLRRYAPCPRAGALFGFLLWVSAVRRFSARSYVATLLARAAALSVFLCGCYYCYLLQNLQQVAAFVKHSRPLACHVTV